MCKAIIGHCQCFRCMEHPAPGVLRGVDFCHAKQQVLAGLWIHTELERARDILLPCNNLTFDRRGDPDACHFKAKKNEGTDEDAIQKQDMHNMEPVMDLAQEKPTKVDDYATIKFTPINAAAIARAALATLNETESSHSHDEAIEEDDMDSPMDDDDQMEAETPPTDDDEEAVKEAVQQASGVAVGEVVAGLVTIGKLPVDKPSPADIPGTKKADKPSSDTGSARSDTDNDTAALDTAPPPKPPKKDNKGKRPAARITSTPHSSSGSGSNNGNPLNRPILTPKKPTPTKISTPTTTKGTQTPNKRTPLPTSRPSTPRVRQAEAAAAAAELAARVSRGAWTHEETLRLLLLRCKQVKYDDMHEFLPGRDGASCMDRLAGLAVKHGYEDYI